MGTSGALTDLNLERWLPSRRAAAVWAVVLYVEGLLVYRYLTAADVVVTQPRYFLIPFVWINVGAWAIWNTTPAPASRRDRWIAGGIAVGYGLVLAYAGGLAGAGHAWFGYDYPATVRVAAAIPPGWGPALLYDGQWLRLSLLPFKIVGYAALTYLVYATVLDARAAAVSGLLGLLSCVSCSWPILASVLTGVVGGSSAAVSAALAASYDVSTAVFVVTVALLYWRPFGR